MAGPPDNIEAAELWKKLAENPRPSDVVEFPRKDADGNPVFRLRIQVLTHAQQDEARERAQRWLLTKRNFKKEELETEIMREVVGDAIAREALALSCRTVNPIPNSDPPEYGRIFSDGPSIADRMTGDEVATLFTMYCEVQRRYGPLRHNTTDEEASEWIRVLGNGASAYPLAHMSWQALAELTMCLARRSCTLSGTIESHWQSLPDTLRSDLEKLNFGTGYFGEQPATDSEPGLPTAGDEETIVSLEAMTVEDAAKIAERLHRSGDR